MATRRGTLVRIRNIAAMIALFGVVGAARGTSARSEIPEFDSPDYWDAHAIGFGEVQVQSDETRVQIRVLQQFSGKAGPTENVFSLKQIRLEPFDEFDERIKLDGYDEVFLVDWNVPGTTTVIYKPEDAYHLQPAFMAESCRLIQEARKGKDLPAALEKVARAADPVAERHVLNALMATDLKAINEKVLATAKALRADAACNMQTRMTASELLQKIALARGEKKDDWEWIEGILRHEQSHSWIEFHDLAERMLNEDGDQRSQTRTLFCELGTNVEEPLVVRAGIPTAGDLGKLLNHDDALAPENATMVEFAIVHLQDASPQVRSMGASVLQHFMNVIVRSKSPPEAWRPLAEKAIHALRAAEAAEKASAQKFHMHYFRECIEKMMAEHQAGN